MTENDARLHLQDKSRETMLKTLAEAMVKAMMEEGWLRSCLNCADWNDKTEICMKYKVRPPAKVIVSSCPEHSEIPF